jgi:hypothetical protein
MWYLKLKERYTGTQKPKNDFGIMVYPNPASDFIQVKSIHAISQVKLVTLSGKEIMTYNQKELNTATDKIDVSQLPKGWYFIRVESPGIGVTTRKIILK